MAKYLALFIAILIIYQAKSQVTVSSLVINTGYNPITGTAISGGGGGGSPVTDPHWIVTGITPDVLTAITNTGGLIAVTVGNNADVVQNAGPWVQNANTGWISCVNSNTYNDPGNGLTNYTMTLGRPFKMCSDDTITLSLNVACDNFFSGGDIDGIPLTIPASSSPEEAFHTYVPVNLTLFLTAGVHTLHFSVTNFNLTSVGSNPTGFNLNGTVASLHGKKSLLSETNTGKPTQDSICAGKLITLHANLDSTFFNWGVLPGGSSITSLNCTKCINPVATPGQTTRYVTIATAGAFCNDTTVVTVISATNQRFDTGICFNTPAQFFIPTQGTAPQSIIWTPNVYLNNNTIVNPICTPLANVSYLVNITYSGALQCSTVDTFNVTVQPHPTVNAGIDQYICTDSFILTATGSTVGLFYSWAPATDLLYPDAATTPGHLQVDSQAYVITVTDVVSGCTGKDTVTIHNNSLVASFTMAKDSICSIDTLSLQNTSTGTSQQLLWSLGNGDTSTLDAVKYNYALGGRYIIRLSVGNSFCADSTKDTVYVFANPVDSIALGLSDSVVCAGSTIKLNAYLPAGYDTVLWDFGSGYIGAGLSLAYNCLTEGTYTIKLKGTYMKCPDMDTSISIKVVPAPIVNLGPDTSLCPRDPGILLANLHIQPGTDYQSQWSTGATTESITADQPGRYYLTVYSGSGCATTDSIDIRPNCYMAIPNAFSPNGDGVNDYFFPRQILARGVRSFHMQVYNRWGEPIFETTATGGRGWDGTFNDQPQVEGVYVYLIEVTYINNVSEKYKGNVTLLR